MATDSTAITAAELIYEKLDEIQGLLGGLRGHTQYLANFANDHARLSRELSQEVDIPTAEVIRYIDEKARTVKTTHNVPPNWITVLHTYWRPSFADTLEVIRLEMQAIRRTEHDNLDPHGEKNG